MKKRKLGFGTNDSNLGFHMTKSSSESAFTTFADMHLLAGALQSTDLPVRADLVQSVIKKEKMNPRSESEIILAFHEMVKEVARTKGFETQRGGKPMPEIAQTTLEKIAAAKNLTVLAHPSQLLGAFGDEAQDITCNGEGLLLARAHNLVLSAE